MKLKSLLFVVFFVLVGQAFAVNQHVHPKANEAVNKNPAAAKSSMYPVYCEIEVINDTYNRINVYGTFDDGAPLVPFTVYGYESHYISLFYYGYCHSGMYLTIESVQFPFNTVVYDSWTYADSTVRVVPYLNKALGGKSSQDNAVKVQVTSKK